LATESCKFSGEELSAFVDGELEGERADAIAAHLTDCDACAKEVAENRRLDEAALKIHAKYGRTAGEVPAERWDRMWRDISDRMDRPGNVHGLPKPVKLNAWRAIAAVAIILIAVVLLFALPWGGEVKNGGGVVEVEPAEEGPMWDIYVSDDYEVTIDPMGDSIDISMVKVVDDKEGS